MALIQTPIGILETNIPTIYGEKHQFRGNDGLSFDIPDWVGWLALVVGLVGGGALGGYVAWNARGALNVFDGVSKTVKGLFGNKK